MISIYPFTLSTVYADTVGSGTVTVLAGKTGFQPYVEFISFIKGANTSVALVVGGNTLRTATADLHERYIAVGDPGDSIQVTVVGAASDSAYAVTCGYIGKPATPSVNNLA